ncbi:MAG TPA: TIGR03986 family CRISPR-associated RAMP protein [Candidatus Obscuribacterales bacterium]
MVIERGELVVQATGKGKPPRVQIRVGKSVFTPAQGEISQTVLDRLKELAGKEVEFERVGGQPKKVREVGGTFVDSRPTPQAAADQHQPSQPSPDFHNPYNFVPAPPRNTSDPDLGDHAPPHQDCFDAGRYSGTIRVVMTAITPLLVPDTEKVQESPDGHKTYHLRLDSQGRPSIPASSVRGMLRSAYETITNSRFGRFSKNQHLDRLAFRMDTSEGLRLIPARIQHGQIHLLTGTSNVRADGRPDGPMYAAWLPRYDRNGQISAQAVTYSDGTKPVHGDNVECWIELFQHHRWDKGMRRHVPDFQYWSVRSIARAGLPLGNAPAPSPPPTKKDETSLHEPVKDPIRKVEGWVCITNANINRKHDERVFFLDSQSPTDKALPLTDEHRKQWRELIKNYQSIHEEDLRKRRTRNQQPDAYLGSKPGETAWSRHVYTLSERELADGTLCYARLTRDRNQVEALFPVMLSRELYPVSAWSLLDDSLRPAESIAELSPADRVFGWVKSNADAEHTSRSEPIAARGLIRIGPVVCESVPGDSVDLFDTSGVPLAILAAPKPQQGRFYVARSRQGEAQSDGLTKAQAGYSPAKGLRGRKVYPHQRSLPEGHWSNPTEDRTQNSSGTPAHYQEYRRPRTTGGQEQRDDQNRSVLGWVKPGAQFSFDIHVHNLSTVELGALLWLLELPEGHYLRFGGGKPLGFGSVRLTIDANDVRSGADLRARYQAWHTTTPPADARNDAITAFKNALIRAYGQPSQGFERVPFIEAFLIACRGFKDNLPYYYPRATANGQPGPPSPDGEFFKWFVANERKDARHSLPDLRSERGLPKLP